MRVLVCGGRDFGTGKPLEWRYMHNVLSAQHDRYGFTAVIEGGAPGADAGARTFGELAGIPVLTFAADWDMHGKAAGPVRNKRMLVEGKPDLVIAFPGGRGTANMVQQATKAGVPVTSIPAP